MNSQKKIIFIVNPVSGNGALKKKWDYLLPKVSKKISKFDCWYTKGPGHATKLTRKALEEGAELVVAVGGDGILSECANGFFKNGEPVLSSLLGVFPLGRGNDFARAMGLIEDPEKTLQRFLTNEKKKVDVIKATLRDENGNKMTHIVLNNAYLGIAEKQETYSAKTPKFLGSVLSYMLGVLRAAIFYKPETLTFLSKEEKETVTINSAVIANGPRFGSGMYPAIKASVDDGLLDISVFKRVAFPFSIDQLIQYYKGNYLNKPWSYYHQTKKVDVESPREGVRVNADGDYIGFLPATFEVLPKILNFKI